MLPAGVAPKLSTEEQEKLTKYAVDSRYPGLEREIGFEETAQAAKWMETARSALRSSFSKDLL